MSIYVFGSIAIDRIMRFPGTFSDYILPEKIADINLSFTVDGVAELHGGTGMNIAYSLAKLGEKPVLLGAAGGDFGRYGAEAEAAGIDISRVVIAGDSLTAGAYITTDATGSQFTFFNPGAMICPCTRLPRFRKNDWLIISPGCHSDMARLPGMCRKSGTSFIYDPGQQIPLLSAEELLVGMDGAALVICNDYEFGLISEKTGLKENDVLGMSGALIVTRGGEGASLYTKDGTALIPAVAGICAVDPTGAGDTFRAGLLKKLSEGASMYDAALFGAAVSSFCVEKVGTQVHDFPPAELAGRLASLGAAEAGKKKQHSTSETKNDAAEEGAHERAALILASLQARYPKAESALDYDNAWELLVATVLAAQCTDARVNTITPAFFAKWPDPQALTDASLEEIETVIHSAGFYHSKAKNLLGAAKKICDGFKGAVPQTLAELVTIPGVARKTANVVLWGAFGINEGLAVDTHVRRLSYRLGLTSRRDPEGIEKDLMKLFPRSEWGDVNHRMVWFGRDVCTARSPKCGACEMAAFCPKREPED